MFKKLILNKQFCKRYFWDWSDPPIWQTSEKSLTMVWLYVPETIKRKWRPESDQRNTKSPKRSVPLIGDRLCWNDQKHNGTHFSGQKKGKNALKWKIGQERDIGKVSPCISSPTVAPLFVYVYISAIIAKLHSIALLPLYSTTLSHKDVNIVDL